ncbi:hypothetical protein [Desmospora profundinema]|uniref:Uncharacterized protein n=1 Tax=Desmospora profundinema TaxID=1571184 RepID=A0ABU1IPU6_9BACL|nr:hypothetical protein [Desmospora profundinema]MDR6226811.1 hypothetical protein [Desmospora profundinema]
MNAIAWSVLVMIKAGLFFSLVYLFTRVRNPLKYLGHRRNGMLWLDPEHLCELDQHRWKKNKPTA